MPFVIVLLAVVALLILMTKLKFNGFIALLLVATVVALVQGVAPADVAGTLTKGVGNQLGSTLVIVGLGAMVGRLAGDAGAAQKIAMALVNKFGDKGVQWAMIVTAVLIGITMFYEVAFVIVVPVAFTLVRATRVNLLWVGLPMSITLSTMHSFLPPHPGPITATTAFNASVGMTLAYGLIIAVPAAIVIAMVWPRLPFIKRMNPEIPKGLVSDELLPEDKLPSFGLSLSMALLPVVLIAGAAVFDMVAPDSPAAGVISFIGAAPIALLIALLASIFVFGPMSGRSLKQVSDSCASSIKAVAMILMVVGAGGAFGQVLKDTGIADYIANMAAGWNLSPIVLAWLIAVILRVALGSATVAVVTAASVVAPIAASSGVSPELMVLAVTCGSIAASHVNDPGFWMFKEYFGLSVGETLKARTSYTTVLSIIGLGGVLLLSLFV
ncbi:MAG: gluconate:H+ symporter [Propionibacteriaceae bacterium]|jgi:Gnt-I system high-affinity gluconate transporter|nr:gluconate:H+ symporter [Propionibacteriaceae bacterium]